MRSINSPNPCSQTLQLSTHNRASHFVVVAAFAARGWREVRYADLNCFSALPSGCGYVVVDFPGRSIAPAGFRALRHGHKALTAQQISWSPLLRRNIRATRQRNSTLTTSACHESCAMGRAAQLICWAPEFVMHTKARQNLKFQALLAERAHGLRHNCTETEQALWRQLSGKQLGIAFRRQVPIDRFIVDFLAPAARLVVEIDGGYHSRRVAADTRRDRVLQRLGYRVMRLDAELVRTRLAEALERIRGALQISK
jgi:very-short-patch-repair endonuclease